MLKKLIKKKIGQAKDNIMSARRTRKAVDPIVLPPESSGREKAGDKPARPVFFPVALLLLALAYDLFPFDLIPDVFPLVGWGDDFIITFFALFNFIEKTVLYRQKSYQYLVKVVKWGVLIFGFLVLLLVVLFFAVIFKLLLQ